MVDIAGAEVGTPEGAAWEGAGGMDWDAWNSTMESALANDYVGSGVYEATAQMENAFTDSYGSAGMGIYNAFGYLGGSGGDFGGFGFGETPETGGTEGFGDYNRALRGEIELQPQMQAGPNAVGAPTLGQGAIDAEFTPYQDATLSPGELADFDTQYQLELEALREQFGIESGRAGATQFASQVDRGIFDSTTGANESMLTQERFADLLAQAEGDLMFQQEQDQTDLLSAKQGLEMGKYSLTEGMNQDQIRTAMEAAMAMSNYYQTGRGITASSNLNNALIKQSYDQQKYNQRGQIGGLVQGIGTGLLKGGLTSLFS